MLEQQGQMELLEPLEQIVLYLEPLEVQDHRAMWVPLGQQDHKEILVLQDHRATLEQQVSMD
jgi:hypothetical protein